MVRRGSADDLPPPRAFLRPRPHYLDTDERPAGRRDQKWPRGRRDLWPHEMCRGVPRRRSPHLALGEQRLAAPNGRIAPNTPPPGVPRAALANPRMERFQELRQHRMSLRSRSARGEGIARWPESVRQWWADLLPGVERALHHQRDARASGVHPLPPHAETPWRAWAMPSGGSPPRRARLRSGHRRRSLRRSNAYMIRRNSARRRLSNGWRVVRRGSRHRCWARTDRGVLPERGDGGSGADAARVAPGAADPLDPAEARISRGGAPRRGGGDRRATARRPASATWPISNLTSTASRSSCARLRRRSLARPLTRHPPSRGVSA